MTKIKRNKQEVFASTAGNREITGFGTAKTETPVYTTDLSLIQNTNFLNGWQSALLPDKSPWQEDMNALFYVVTKQLAYLFQEGIPEYDTESEYTTGSLVKSIDNQGKVTIYKSLSNENLGHSLNDGKYWSVYMAESSDEQAPLAAYEIGLPQPTFSNNLYSNEVWLEGAEVSRTTYSKLFEIYGTTYGAGDGSTTFKLPDCRNKVFWGATNFGYLGAELPNVAGDIGTMYGANNTKFSGCFKGKYLYQTTREWGAGGSVYEVSLNASNLSSIYKNNGTVRPPAIKCRVKTRYV